MTYAEGARSGSAAGGGRRGSGRGGSAASCVRRGGSAAGLRVACGCRVRRGCESAARGWRPAPGSAPAFGWRSARAFDWLRAACAFCCLCLAALLACLPAAPAFAEDDGNVVNEQQLPDSSFIYDTSIFALSGADSYYDNQTVQVVGEAIGDAVNVDWDGSHKWVTLFERDANTGNTATISVYMTSETAARIDTFGAYGKTGTTLQVRGTFHLVCPEHEGMSDLHASNVTVVQKGSEHPDEFNAQAFVPGAVCLVVGLLILFVFYRLRERRR